MGFVEAFSEFPILETERTLLRKLSINDAEALYNYYSDEAILKYLNWDGPTSVENAIAIINNWNDWFEEKRIIRWGIVLKENNLLIGTCFYGDFMGEFRSEIGYDLSKEYWNKGIMTEVIKEILPFGFSKLGLVRIQATANTQNIASIKVLEKCGFIKEGILKSYLFHPRKKLLRDVIMFSILQGDL